jgi:UDP-2,3-diacylglucosamine pyrophosphatase LpxH
VGAQAYGAVVALNKAVNGARKKLRLPQWSLAAYVKRKVKDAGQYVVRFERAVAAEAKLRGFDGVVCGHIHHADLKHIDGVLYANDGDWVESCTAMAEDAQGRLSILRWAGAKAGQPESVAAAA